MKSVLAFAILGVATLFGTVVHCDVSSLISEEEFDLMLKHRNDPSCPAHGFFTYEAFIAAANTFPEFGKTGDVATKKREIAAFFAQTSHATKGGWETAPDGPFAWGYCFKEEIGSPSAYCVHSDKWPCVKGKKYYCRGPFLLAFNYNYGCAGEALGLDLLSNPELVSTNATISFQTAIWYWMTTHPRKPSPHDVITGKWTPSDDDIAAGRLPGYGVITNIINGELECGFGYNDKVENRIGFYDKFCEILGVIPGNNLDCYDQEPFYFSIQISKNVY